MQTRRGTSGRYDHNRRHAATKGIAAGLGLALLCLFFQGSAQASTEFAYIATCSCVTTADFESAALTVGQVYPPTSVLVGTYVMVSSKTARTAYIQVTFHAQFILQEHRVIVTPVSAIPIDANGNSLAGDSEGAQEAVYTAIDTNIMMANRSDPHITLGAPLPGFFSHDDGEISAAFFNSAVTDASSLPNGATVTLTWGDGSGIVAVYTVVWLGDDHEDVKNFALKWVSATQHGKPINRNGAPIGGQQNNGGGSTGGIVLVSDFGSGDWTWSGAGDPVLPGVTITVGDPEPVDDFPPTEVPVPDGP